MREYERLAIGEDSTYLTTYFSDRLGYNINHKDVAEVLSHSIPGTPLLDLGAGPRSYWNAERVAEVYNAEAYIGVDLGLTSYSNWKHNSMPSFLIPGDMLLNVAKVNTRSANFTFNGIDWCYGDYGEAIVDEVERAVKPKGVVFGVGSEAIVYNLSKRDSFEEVEFFEKFDNGVNYFLHLDFFCYRKKD
tara:strand:+ start:189 stop:755 length:567 start_codon:yes stop_codon:yes gene_type:complete